VWLSVAGEARVSVAMFAPYDFNSNDAIAGRSDAARVRSVCL
jgi:hypothetical protein